MRRIRIGKDITIKWDITTNGENIPLEGRDLTLVLTDPSGRQISLPFTTSACTVTSLYEGVKQSKTGPYSLTLWECKGKLGQTAVDRIRAFELVPHTELEN